MSRPFGPEYASAYDLLYADKDYDAECDILEEAFRAASRPVRTVLDLGCGTGAHAIRLVQRGYTVVGVDISGPMLELARLRATEAGVSDVDLVLGDVRDVRLDRTFDAVICMFAVLGYQTTDDDVRATLETVRWHLNPGGTFVFDVWYGPAVEATGPEARVKVVPVPGGALERHAKASLQTRSHLCRVSYRLVLRRDGQPDQTVDETHEMRYFFADELSASLDGAGLSLMTLKAFPGLGEAPSAATWNVIATAGG
jgi:SAM-dependent methyltransferase